MIDIRSYWIHKVSYEFKIRYTCRFNLFEFEIKSDCLLNLLVCLRNILFYSVSSKIKDMNLQYPIAGLGLIIICKTFWIFYCHDIQNILLLFPFNFSQLFGVSIICVFVRTPLFWHKGLSRRNSSYHPLHNLFFEMKARWI